MTKRELRMQVEAFKATACTLSKSLHQLQNAITAIEVDAEQNEGELTAVEAERHEVLTQILDEAYKEITDVLNKFP